MKKLGKKQLKKINGGTTYHCLQAGCPTMTIVAPDAGTATVLSEMSCPQGHGEVKCVTGN
ncbi:hypothetical protein CMU59_18595 [Elizabethkingia anophelis]|uniref:hypothetical protein n=1 Tax=Elizabethkingia anophelis TaxID=1117645 RepID=UPI0004E30986|nr:hypothetical protein [Elizabethkingia anophelis]KFC36782.1 hypothetical protein FF18_01455 [Elizabethkingia anophelis]MCL1688297.1 hypothetical protein [Elizabethkingia anophelis]MCT3786655.1 hypothetical protein [Elizabethkingia anophelis]MCT3899296.1 hypothetical protein [Elizabethkingia anophelis]MDV3501156.1 hypothetical protein [Elizabethkingia anophelis]